MSHASVIKPAVLACKNCGKKPTSDPTAATAESHDGKTHKVNIAGKSLKYLLMCLLFVSVFAICLFPADTHAWDPNNNWNNGYGYSRWGNNWNSYNNSWSNNSWNAYNNGWSNNNWNGYNDWNSYNRWNDRWSNNVQTYRDNYGSYQWQVRGALPYNLGRR